MQIAGFDWQLNNAIPRPQTKGSVWLLATEFKHMLEQKEKKIAFRVDAAPHMGLGHVMRCLSLSKVMRQRGWRTHFITRCSDAIDYSMFDIPREYLHFLPDLSFQFNREDPSSWLGDVVHEDAEQTKAILQRLRVDHLCVDHYAIDAVWEGAVAKQGRVLLAIDDIFNRQHETSILVDQNFGRLPQHYSDLVGENTKLLLGSQYAIIREEFCDLRDENVAVGQKRLGHRSIVISLGGVDFENHTLSFAVMLLSSADFDDYVLHLIVTDANPYKEDLKALVAGNSDRCRLFVSPSNYARLVQESQFVIGAAGSSSWERCCLGKATALCVFAENQRPICENLASAGAAMAVFDYRLDNRLVDFLSNMKSFLAADKSQMELVARSLVDGKGASRIIDAIEAEF